VSKTCIKRFCKFEKFENKNMNSEKIVPFSQKGKEHFKSIIPRA